MALSLMDSGDMENLVSIINGTRNLLEKKMAILRIHEIVPQIVKEQIRSEEVMDTRKEPNVSLAVSNLRIKLVKAWMN